MICNCYRQQLAAIWECFSHQQTLNLNTNTLWVGAATSTTISGKWMKRERNSPPEQKISCPFVCRVRELTNCPLVIGSPMPLSCCRAWNGSSWTSLLRVSRTLTYFYNPSFYNRRAYACRCVLEQDTEPQNAPDVLVGTLHGSHHCINVCMNYCKSP